MSNQLKTPTAQEFVGKIYLGVVEDNADPLKNGRARIRVYSIFDDIPTADLPWAVPSQKATFFGQAGKGGSISIPKVGAFVKVEFDHGDVMNPMYYEVQELEESLKAELGKTPVDTNYDNFHGILFDGDVKLKMWYTKEKGLTLMLDSSRVNIATDNSITIEHKDTQSIIELQGGTIRITSDSQINLTAGSQIKASSSQVWVDGQHTRIGHSPVNGPAVLGDKLFLLLKVMAAAIDSKMPSTPGWCANFVETFKATALSNTVIVGM